MRLTLTVVDPAVGDRADLLIEAEPDTTVDRLAAAVGDFLERRPAAPQPSTAGATVLRLPRPSARQPRRHGRPPTLHVDGRPVPPALTLAESRLRDGAVVSLDDPSGCLLPEPAGLVEVRVVSGPGAGVVHRLGLGEWDVGASPVASVRLDDPSVPDRVLRLTVNPYGECRVLPLAAALLDAEPLTEETAWRPGSQIAVGGVLLELATPTPADAALEPSDDGAGFDYNRPPRLLPPMRQTKFRLPQPPSAGERRPLPIIMALTPLVMAVFMAMMLKHPRYLIIGILSPLAMIANFIYDRKAGRRSFRRRMAEYQEHKDRIEADARAALAAERVARRAECPDPAEILVTAVGPRRRLWERRRHDPDHLLLRVGTADLPSEVVLDDPTQDEHRRSVTWTAPDVPASIPLRDQGVLGVAGRGDLPRAIGRWLVTQTAVLHSPDDLSLYLLTDSDGRDGWEWVRWLPHVRSDDDRGGAARVAADSDGIGRRVSELVGIINSRREAARGSAAGTMLTGPDVVVVLDGARRLRSLPGVIQILREGPEVGVFSICLDADERLLPEECRAVVVEEADGLRVQQPRTDVVERVRPDLVSPAWCERVARALAPIRDVSGEDEEASLPGSSRLLDVLALQPPTGQAIASRWRISGRSTEAIIGETFDGPFAIDLRRDGPHGLVAGTTGSGKSELLQTIIASLAVRNRPDEMTFVLVDYKGGAAFKDCADLPHTVGMVTDLDGHLTTRALESLGAELKRREHVLARARAKDIEDYLATRGPDDEPMPRLLIVIDEFAALVAELPDFVNGLVDIARRGRSLGVHLILATQRPAGVVSAEIKSNTNLRIALRVTDSGDSQDVIESDVAAHIAQSTPGRAFARLGHSSLVPFQSSRVGGRPRTEGDAEPIEVRELPWQLLGTASLAPPPRDAEDDASTPTDLATLVAAIREASDLLGVHAPPSPWLPPLPELVVLDELADRSGEQMNAEPPAVPALPIGLADLPAEQRQQPMVWDIMAGSHLAIVGQTRSGRSSVLRLIAGGIGRFTSPTDVHLYGIDCGNSALLPLIAMPHVGAIVGRDQPERLRRLLAMLGGEVSRRQQMLAAQGFAEIAEQRNAAAPDDRLPYLILLLDRWEGYIAAFETVDGGALVEQLLQLLREGPAVGLRAAISGDRSLLTGRIGAAMEDRILLRMPSTDDYSLIGMRGKDVPTRMPAGRSFRSGEVPIEAQLALLTADPAGTAQVAALQRIAAEATARAGQLPVAHRPRRVDELPVTISYADAISLAERSPSGTELAVGVGGDTLSLRTLDVMTDGQGFLVVGPPRSGRSTALLTVIEYVLAQRWKVAVVAPRRSPLRDLAGRPGILGVFTDTAEPTQLREAIDVRGRRMLVVDDYEVLGAEHAIAGVAEEFLKSIRDTPSALVVACGVDEITAMYRGVTTSLRRARTGLILSPRSSTDGDVFAARLPRSVGGVVPTGRGILITPVGWEWVQVPVPPNSAQHGRAADPPGSMS